MYCVKRSCLNKERTPIGYIASGNMAGCRVASRKYEFNFSNTLPNMITFFGNKNQDLLVTVYTFAKVYLLISNPNQAIVR